MAIVLPEKQLIVVPMPDKEGFELLDRLFPVYTLPLSDGEVIVLPHRADVVRILKNMGVNVQGCEIFKWYYTPPKSKDGYSPWWWQLETASFLVQNPFSFVTSTPRTGKTLSVLMAVEFIQQWYGGKALIVAPLTVANGGEWEKTCTQWFPNKRVKLIHKNREEDLNYPADIYLINPDGVKLVSDKIKYLVDNNIITIAVIDELTNYANHKSQRWVALNNAIKGCSYKWGITGTPGKPEKIYGQVKIVNPNNVPTAIYKWRDMTEVKVSPFKWVPRNGYEEIVEKAMSPCIRFEKDKISNIPIPTVLHEEVSLSPEQDKMINGLTEALKVAAAGESITVTTASTLAQKILQVSGGVVKAENGNLVYVDATPKLNKLLEILNRTPRKKVVFSSFTAINNMLVDYIRKAGFTCEKVDGSITGKKRAQILTDFLDAEDPHVLVCHPTTTAFGVELASADYIICYGVPLTGSFTYQQLFERLSSARQEATETFVVHLSAGKQDKLSFAALAKGVNIEKNLVSIFTKSLE